MFSRVTRTISQRVPTATAVRSFTAAAEVQVPKQLFGVHGTYATALFKAASADKSLNKVEKEIANFTGHINENAALRSFLSNPTIPRKAKKADIEAIMAKGKFSPATVAFFGTLAENGRLAMAGKIGEKFTELMQASRGEVQAVVTSAEPLSNAQMKTLNKSLGSFLEKGQTLSLETRVNADILGGLTVQIGDRFMDLSIANKIQKMHGLLSENV